MTHSIEEARNAVQRSRMFGHAPPSWATELLESPASESVDYEALFRRVGLCESDARIAARGLREGTYLSFEDAVSSRLMWDTQKRNHVRSYLVTEVARSLPTRKALSERRATWQGGARVLERASARIDGDSRVRVCLISAGQGSSGYYPAETLAEAARSGAFPAGLHAYLDHPTATEEAERPERSVRDLAGVFETAASYTDGALYGTVRVFAEHQKLITEAAPYIGMSIRGSGTVENRTVDGVPRNVVTRLGPIESCDFVTAAGRGGRIVSTA